MSKLINYEDQHDIYNYDYWFKKNLYSYKLQVSITFDGNLSDFNTYIYTYNKRMWTVS